MRKKIKNIKYFTSSIALLTSLWMPKAEAHLNFKMMKDATSFLNPGMEHYSLILGKTALESGLFRNIRLLDVSDPGFDPEKNQRVYSQDTNQLNPGTLLKALFPSTDGSLKAYAGKVAYTPKILGHLINFTYDIRHQKNSDQAINDFLFANGDISKNDRRYFKGILGNIQKAINQETQNTFLYPQGTTEQIILAFACEKLNSQKESYEFMDTLRSEIVSPDQHEILKAKISSSSFQENLLTKETIAEVFQKANDTPYTLDDVYALAHAKNFVPHLSPYIEDPGQNISIPAYNRQSKQNSSTLKFSDCLETTLRHVFNSILYMPEEGEFNLKTLKVLKTQQPDNLFLNYLINFYQSMSIEQAISNDEKTHILWNQVVGDLNAYDTVDSTKVTYIQHSSDAANPFEYELETGVINMVRVFQKILGVTLNSLGSEASLDEKQIWVEASLNHIFTILNPLQGYQIKFNDDNDDNPYVAAFNEDIIGILSVVTLDKDREEKAEKLSLNINLLEDHGYVDDIKTIRPLSVQEQNDFNKILSYEKGLEIHSTKFESREASKEIFQNLWLLNLQDSDLKKNLSKRRFIIPFISSLIINWEMLKTILN